MKWKRIIRASGLVEWQCEHGVGHPDQSSVKTLEYLTGQKGWGIHGCELMKIMRTKQVSGISMITYVFLDLAILCYFIHAIEIGDPPFMVANGLNLTVNVAISVLLWKYR